MGSCLGVVFVLSERIQEILLTILQVQSEQRETKYGDDREEEKERMERGYINRKLEPASKSIEISTAGK